VRPIRTFALFFGAVASAVLLPSATARAGGVILYEVGTPDVGYASAGWAARAEGPVTVLTNPAGMTRLDGIQVELGTQALYGQLQFSPDALTTVPGTNGGNAIGWLPGGGLFASYAVGKNLRFGLGLFSNFGLTESWQNTPPPGWVGRYYGTKSTLIGLSVMPAVSYHLVAGLSLGATLNAMYGHLDYSSDINNAPLTMTDGTVSVSSNTWGVGGNVGLLYEFSERSRLGLTYTSPVSLNFSAQPTFTNVRQGGLGNQTLGLGMTVPQTLMLSYYQGLSDKLALMADVGWQNWGAFGTVEVSLPDASNPANITTAIGYNNTWHGALGGQIQLSDPLQLDLGVAYDSTMTTTTNRSLPLAIGWAWRFGTGLQWAVDPHWNLGLAYEFLWGGSPFVDVNRGPLAGHVQGAYSDTWFQFIAFSVTWKS
jgi:long-chain fatty acid transport protein